MASADDVTLMARVSAGSVEAFGELFERFCDRAYRVALSVCHDEQRAEDAVQEAFLSVWRSSRSYRPRRGSVAGWILTGVRYRAIDLARVNGRHAAHQTTEDRIDSRPATDELSETVIERDDARRLRNRLAKLPEAQREVIALAYYGELSHREIAAMLGLPTGTVKGRMRLGLERLRADSSRAA